jgi:predicted molibdopterin-dependent oxidoreductase YjgC
VRALRAGLERQVNLAIGYGYGWAKAKIGTTGYYPYHESDGVFCGQCVDICPVGALTENKARARPASWGDLEGAHHLPLQRRGRPDVAVR